jgi:ADP-heptose:LPS heptosyltransferase
MTRRALVARLDSVGDVLLAGPAVRAVASSPDVDEVWFLCSSIGASAARLLPGVDHVLVWDCPWITASAPPLTAEHLAELDALVARCLPEVAVILTSFHQSPLPLALQLRLAGVPRIVGASVDYAGPLLDVRLVPGEDFSEDQPEPLRALAIAAAAGFAPAPGDEGGLRIASSAALPDAVSRLLDDPAAGGAARQFVVVHPGASVSSRRWPAERHRQTVLRLTELGAKVVVTGGPAERELTREVAGAEAVDLGGDTPLDSLAAVLARASVVVTGNTGPAHLAAAVRTPVVSLFSPVVPASRWAPYGVPHVLLGDQDAACRGTRATECPVAGHPCLNSVTAEQVVEACLELAPQLAQGAPLAGVAS